jgi:hypothetical protein
VRQLCVRTCVARNVQLEDYTDLAAEALAERAQKGDAASQRELLEVYGLFASEYDYRPVNVTTLPLGEFALAFGKTRTKKLLHSYGAIQALERLLELVHDDGFILANDYGQTQVTGKDEFEHQRFSLATFVGVNFSLLKAYFGEGGRAHYLEPYSESGSIHSRLVGHKLSYRTSLRFQERFSHAAAEALQEPIAKARECLKVGRFELASSFYQQALARQPGAVAPAPVQIIDKGLPGPGLLAQIVANKYDDHLPLHRLERILGRHDIELSRSTMCGWTAQVAELLRPVVKLMADLVRHSKMIHTDATKLPYLDPQSAPGRTLSGQMWIYYGDRAQPFNVFDFCGDHSARGIDAFLRDQHYHGYLNADALNVYDHLFKNGDIIELGCWTHCRRHFYESKDSDAARAHLVLARIRQLYQVEEQAKKIIAQRQLQGADADAIRLQMRREQSVPVINGLRQWLVDESPQLLPKSPISQATAYALRHWQALTRYLEDGFLDIDNNVAELALRHIAIGRKNWLFAGSTSGAKNAAILFSVTSTCQRHRVDSFAYLHDLLQRLAHDPQPAPESLHAWLPDRWRPPPAGS